MYRFINITNYLGKLKQQEKLKMCANDLKLAKYLRGWIKQEINSIERNSKNNNNKVKKRLKVPPGYQLAHEKGREKAKGFGYEHSNLILKSDHKIQHKFDNNGKSNNPRHFQKIYINHFVFNKNLN
tara:strand:+ start:1286 stop:1663 length:378 start_codon:yes stop_codon:yes gene_type:complete